MGGATTVRGYPTSGITGNDGYHASFEVHRAVARAGGADGFVLADRGGVFAPLPEPVTVQSVGLGGNVDVRDRCTASVTIALPLLRSIAGQHGMVAYARLVVHAF